MPFSFQSLRKWFEPALKSLLVKIITQIRTLNYHVIDKAIYIYANITLSKANWG